MSNVRGKPRVRHCRSGAFIPRAFARDESGAIAVILALLVGVMAGMMALAMDLGKAWNLETELQHSADACALAGATQLDGSDGARVRAIEACTNAVSKLIANQQTFASDGFGAVVVFDALKTIDGGTGIANNRDLKFYQTLPIATSLEADSDENALYMEANVFPRRVDFSFAAVVGAVSSTNPKARAVAGWQSFFCDSPPMMMCNPSEDPAGDAGAGFNMYTDCPNDGDGPSCVGRGITMKARAGAPEPGDFGYLALSVLNPDGTVDTVNGAAALYDALAGIENGAACTGNQVTTAPGNIASVDQAINMRFDLYPNLASAMTPNLQPAPNVGRGLITKPSFDPAAGNCKFSPQTPADPGDWKHPRVEDVASPYYNDPLTDPQFYLGPGMHQMVDLLAPIGEPDPHPDFPADLGLVERSDPLITDVFIRAMAFPKDTCNYTWGNTDQPVYEASIGGDPLLAGSAGCLFKKPPGDPTPESTRQMGTGQWDIQTYLDVYHRGLIEDDLIFPCIADPADSMCADKEAAPGIPRNGIVSRWELYNWELSEFDAGVPEYPHMAFEEEPICYKGGASFPDTYNLPEPPAVLGTTPDRRIMIMAVVNCAAMGGGKRTVDRTKPHGNVAVFMTEPMGYSLPDTLYGELVDPLGLGLGVIDDTPDLVQERILLIE